MANTRRARPATTEKRQRILDSTEEIILEREMTADDIEAWDSVSHITLIYAVEEEFDFTFSSKDLGALGCVGDLMDIIRKRA